MGLDFRVKYPEEINFVVNKYIEILKYLRVVILKFLGQGKNKTSKSLY